MIILALVALTKKLIFKDPVSICSGSGFTVVDDFSAARDSSNEKVVTNRLCLRGRVFDIRDLVSRYHRARRQWPNVDSQFPDVTNVLFGCSA